MMQLDGLGQDAVLSVLGNLDAKTLFRVGKVSKYFRLIVVVPGKKDSSGGLLLRAAVLNSFPGITNVPVGKEYSYYQRALRFFYHPIEHRHRYCRLSFITDVIGGCLSKNYIQMYGRPMSSEQFDEDIFDLCQWLHRSSGSAHGLKEFLQSISDWRVSISLDKTQFHVDAGAVLDRISALASSNFTFKQKRLQEEEPHLWYGVITVDMDSIPEVARHKQRIIIIAAAAVEN